MIYLLYVLLALSFLTFLILAALGINVYYFRKYHRPLKLSKLGENNTEAEVDKGPLGNKGFLLVAERLSEVNWALDRIADQLKELQLIASRGSDEKAAHRSEEAIPIARKPDFGNLSHSDKTHQLLELYNRAVLERDDSILNQSCWGITKFGTANVSERAQDNSVKPRFMPDHDGNFLACRFDNMNDDVWLVFPDPNLSIQRNNYGPGAIREVFECHSFDPDYRYNRFKVLKPASFMITADGEIELLEAGEIELLEAELI